MGSILWVVAIGSYTAAYLTVNKTLKVVFWSVFLLGALMKLISLFVKKPGRTTEGIIAFEKDNITVDGTIYNVSTIEKLEFTDYGNFLRKNESFSGDKESWPNGKDVRVFIKLEDGDEVMKYFQLTHRGQMQDIRLQLVHYHNEGKLHFLNLIDILGIEDYNAIQIFKKSLPDGGDIKSY